MPIRLHYIKFSTFLYIVHAFQIIACLLIPMGGWLVGFLEYRGQTRQLNRATIYILEKLIQNITDSEVFGNMNRKARGLVLMLRINCSNAQYQTATLG